MRLLWEKSIVCLTFLVKRAILFAKEVLDEKQYSNVKKKSKITQQELADAVLVTRQTIISLEKEKYTASLILAYKIARYFDLSIEEVFNFSEEDENCDK